MRKILLDCTSGIEMTTRRRMTRPKEFDEQIAFLVEKGTHARIEAVLLPGEKKGDFYRVALDNEVKRRRRSRVRDS